MNTQKLFKRINLRNFPLGFGGIRMQGTKMQGTKMQLDPIIEPVKPDIPALFPKKIPQIKIYEMFMRDGLQSLPKIFTLEQKLQMIKELNKFDYYSIEFGSMTSAKLLPQMAQSDELFKLMEKKEKIKYAMLVPGFNQIPKALDLGINSFGLVCSMSDIFGQKNLKKDSKMSVEGVYDQIELIRKHNEKAHIRVYLSCSFGSPWESFNTSYINNLFVTVCQN